MRWPGGWWAGVVAGEPAAGEGSVLAGCCGARSGVVRCGGARWAWWGRGGRSNTWRRCARFVQLRIAVRVALVAGAWIGYAVNDTGPVLIAAMLGIWLCSLPAVLPAPAAPGPSPDSAPRAPTD